MENGTNSGANTKRHERIPEPKLYAWQNPNVCNSLAFAFIWELRVAELTVQAILREQLAVSARFHNCPIVHNYNSVSVYDC